MAVYPGIALETRVPQIQNIGDVYGETMQARDLLRQRKLRDAAQEQSARAAKVKRFGEIAGAVAAAGTPEAYQQGIQSALSEGILSPEEAAEYAKIPWSPEVLAGLKQAARQAMTVSEQMAADDRAADRELAETKARQDRNQGYATEKYQQGRLAETERKNAADEAQKAREFLESQYQANRTLRRLENPPPAAPTGDAAQFAYRQSLPPEQQAAFDEWLKKQKPPTERNPTEASLALAAAQGDPRATKALALLRQQKASAGGMGVALDVLPSPPGTPPAEAMKKYSASAQRLARQLVGYDIPMPSGVSQSKEPWVSAIQAAGELDPNWQADQYNARRAVKQDFGSGKTSQNIRSLNTAIRHIKSFRDAGLGLGNTEYQTINRVKNWFAGQGPENAKLRRFGMAANAVAGELATVFKGTAGTDQEIKAWRAEVENSDGPKAIEAEFRQAVELLAGRLYAIRDVWERTLPGRPLNVLSKDSREILKSLGIDPEEIEGGAARPVQPSAGPAAPAGAPEVGGTFNGEKVLKVTRLP